MIVVVQERAAWDFVTQENPEFTLAVVRFFPPVLPVDYLHRLDSRSSAIRL